MATSTSTATTTAMGNGTFKTVDAKGSVSYSQTPPQDAPVISNQCLGVVCANPSAHADVKSHIDKAKKISKIPEYMQMYNDAQFAKARLVPGAGNGVASAVSAYGKASKVLETPSAIPITGNILNNSERTKTAIEATKAAEKGQAVLNAAGKAPTAAAGAAAGRVLGAGLGVFIEALKPEVHSGGGAIFGMSEKKRLVKSGVLTAEEGDLLPGMYARGEYSQIRELTDAGLKRMQGK